jgi:hypothetical protein
MIGPQILRADSFREFFGFASNLVRCEWTKGSAHDGRAKTSALRSVRVFVLFSPCAGFEPFVIRQLERFRFVTKPAQRYASLQTARILRLQFQAKARGHVSETLPPV